MKPKDIVDAWAWIRKNNHSIPDDVLDLMKDAAIEKLQSPSAEVKEQSDPEIVEAVKDWCKEMGEVKEQQGVDVDKAGVIALKILENVNPKLTDQEQAIFIAGFQECIKWINNQ